MLLGVRAFRRLRNPPGHLVLEMVEKYRERNGKSLILKVGGLFYLLANSGQVRPHVYKRGGGDE